MRDILVEIDEGSGCCFGVVNATQKAENTLEKEGILFSLGDIVHNSEEVSRLSNKGLKSIDNEHFEQLANTKNEVIINNVDTFLSIIKKSLINIKMLEY